ncbi:hypothetical protein BME96_05520 [Virgibacillus halodenitrificans]|uniref:Uncharacterized protein n=1 Tax=Virgibacillus halodenitrificans TaxID=1482 RepID=A0AAC9IXW4_VIRHA|nr:hypothetical protein BME96_05520 [Virgibacillus halodenitrificans]
MENLLFGIMLFFANLVSCGLSFIIFKYLYIKRKSKGYLYLITIAFSAVYTLIKLFQLSIILSIAFLITYIGVGILGFFEMKKHVSQ